MQEREKIHQKFWRAINDESAAFFIRFRSSKLELIELSDEAMNVAAGIRHSSLSYCDYASENQLLTLYIVMEFAIPSIVITEPLKGSIFKASTCCDVAESTA